MGGGPIVDDEQGLGLHLGEGACQEEEEEEEAVESMNVKDLKAKAMEVCVGGSLSGRKPWRFVWLVRLPRRKPWRLPRWGTAVSSCKAGMMTMPDRLWCQSGEDGTEERRQHRGSWLCPFRFSGDLFPCVFCVMVLFCAAAAAAAAVGGGGGGGGLSFLVAVAAPPAEEDEVPASGDDDSAGPLPPGVAAVRPPEDGGGVLHPPVEAGGDEEMGEPAGGAAGLQAEEGGMLEHGVGDGDGRGGEGAADAQGGVARGQQEGIVREVMVVGSVPAVVGPTPSLRESLGSAGAVSTGPGSDAEEESGGGITAAAAAAVASGSTAPGDGGVISADSSGGVVAYGGRAEAHLSALESDDGEDVVEPEPVEDDDEMTEGYAVGEGLVEESGGVDGAGEESGVRYREVEGGGEVGGDRYRLLGEREEDGGSGGERGDGQRGEEEEEAGFDSEEESLVSSAAAGEPVTAVSCPAETEQGGAAGQSGVEEGAGDSGEEEEEVVVPTAEELTEKYLEVERLWRPILLNSGLAGGVGGGTNTPLQKGELLLETEALKEKARVLAAWFHPDAGPADRRCSKSSAASSVDRSKSGVGGSAGGTGRGAGGAAAAAARKAAGVVGAGVEASTTMQGYRSAATGTPAMARSRRGSTASTSGASSRPSESESSGGGSKWRPGKARGSGQRLSVSPPRAKVSAAAAAAARAGASRRPSGGKGMPPAAKTLSATAPPSSLRKRNPLIRASSSSPRPPRASVSRPTAGEGVAKRHVATRRRGGSVAGSAAGRLKGAPSGDTAVTKTPARSEMLRSRKASLVGGNSAGKVPASKHTSPGFFSSSKARRGSVATQEGSATSINGNRVQDSRRAVGNPGSVGKGGGTPTGEGEGGRGGGGTPGSGSRPALQVFGFDPAVSTSPRDARGIPNTSSPEGVGDTRLLSPYHHPVIMRSLEEAALTTGGGAADVPPVTSMQ
ncbi:unnamed protein product [Ectocarpus sp. 8 AP-2014]